MSQARAFIKLMNARALDLELTFTSNTPRERARAVERMLRPACFHLITLPHGITQQVKVYACALERVFKAGHIVDNVLILADDDYNARTNTPAPDILIDNAPAPMTPEHERARALEHARALELDSRGAFE